MKKIISLLLALTMALGLAACGKQGGQSEVVPGEKIKLTIGAEKTFNNRVLYPSIVAGTEAVDFYG